MLIHILKTLALLICYPGFMKPSRFIIIITITLLIVIGGGAAFYAVTRPASDSTVHIPANIRSRVSFPLYVPEKIPDGMSIDEKSFSATDQVVTYQVKYDNSKKLNVSIQARDASVDPENYPGDESFTVLIGKVVVVDRPDRKTAAVFADKSWVLINAPQLISSEQLRAFVDSLRKEQ